MTKALHAAVLGSCGLLALTVPAMAQTTTPTDAPPQAAPATAATPEPGTADSDDIIVTARRRAERLQSVPLAITAVPAAVLERENINSIALLSRVAPALTSYPGQGANRSVPNFAIRGLSQQELSSLADPSVPVYLGDVVAPRVQGLNGAIFDIGSVEVLRGPQGTLFGRNTTGGAVVIRPNRPTDDFEGRLGTTFGNLGTFNLEGMVNVPLGENVIVRLAGTRNRDDGFVYDELLGRNVNYTRQEAGRASLLLRDGKGLENLTVYDYFHENDGGTPTFIKFSAPNGSFDSPAALAARNYQPLASLLAAQQARGIYRIASGLPAFTYVETNTVANTTTVPLGSNITFRNILGYRSIKDHTIDDGDGTSNSLQTQERIDSSWQFSEEAQVLGESPKFNWIVGAYYFKEKGDNQGVSASGAVDPGAIEPTSVFALAPNTYSNTHVIGRNQSFAFFAQGTYNFSGPDRGFSITAGARYNQDRREATILNRTATACRFTRDLDGNPATPETAVSLADCSLTVNRTFSEPTYNISLEYRFDRDLLIYVAHRHGYRTGGYGARAATEAGLRRTFEPEIVNDIEAGLKADWHLGDAFLRTNIAAYYAGYSNIQRLLADATVIPVTTVTANAGKARIWGVEVDALFRPVKGLELTANYAYTNARFTQFANPFNGADLSNQPFARAPRNVYTLGARYTLPLNPSSGDFSIGGSYYHTDSFNGSDTYVPVRSVVDGWNLVNADISWNRILGSNFDAALFVNNLTKTRYSLLFLNIDAFGFSSFTPGAPRTYGITLRAHFGGKR